MKKYGTILHLIILTIAVIVNIAAIYNNEWNFAIGQSLIICPLMALQFYLIYYSEK